MATLIQTLQHVLAGKDPLLAPETRRIILKEVLQAYVLDFLYNHPVYRRLNFYGGARLHLVYGLNRQLMQQRVQPLEEKLAKDGKQPYSVESAMLALQKKVARIKPRDLALDLLPMFESRSYIEAWLEAFQENFQAMVKGYLGIK